MFLPKSLSDGYKYSWAFLGSWPYFLDYKYFLIDLCDQQSIDNLMIVIEAADAMKVA